MLPKWTPQPVRRRRFGRIRATATLTVGSSTTDPNSARCPSRRSSLTAAGRAQLTHKRDEFDRIIFAIHRVLEAT